MMKDSVSSFLQLSPVPMTGTPSLQEEILEACSGKDVANLRSLLEGWHNLLLKQAGGSGGVDIVQQLLDQYGVTEPQKQLLLVEAAQKGNAEVFRFLLQQWPSYPINKDLRSKALDGGVEIWKAILDHSPKLINYTFGHVGNLVTIAVTGKDVPLLKLFLDKGLDPNESHFFTKPIFIYASEDKTMKKEILDLLVEYGATTEKSLAAYRSIRGL